MRCWVVPSSLFVSGQLMSPIQLTREKEKMIVLKAKLEAELAALPAKIADHEQKIAKLGKEYLPFKAMEKN